MMPEKVTDFSSSRFGISLHLGAFLSVFYYQRTNGLVNAHLISGPSKSTKQTKPGNKYEKDLINNS